MTIERKKWTKADIKSLLQTNDEAVQRGIFRIWEYQTTEEAFVGETRQNNGVGFNKIDAQFLTSLALQYQRKGYLTQKQIRAGRKAVMKYAGQLAKIANGEQ